MTRGAARFRLVPVAAAAWAVAGVSTLSPGIAAAAAWSCWAIALGLVAVLAVRRRHARLGVIAVLTLAAAAATASHVALAQPSRTALEGMALDGGRAVAITADVVGKIISSQNFEAGYTAYDDAAADDFTLATTCKVAQVDVWGTYNTTDKVKRHTENVTFYSSAGKYPLNIVAGYKGLRARYDDGLGNLEIKMPSVITLPPGTYWLSVVMNLDRWGKGGAQWYWDGAYPSMNGQPAVWENPGGGFGIGCLTWTPFQSCDDGFGPYDMAFELLSRKK